MNLIEIAQWVREEAGISGTGPTSVTNQTGMNLQLLRWVNLAWWEIQTASEDWLWMRDTAVFDVSADKQTYTPAEFGLANVVRRWRLETAKIYKVADGAEQERYLQPYEYDEFVRTFNLGNPDTAAPTGVAEREVSTGNEIMFGPVPDEAYAITVGYMKNPTKLLEGGSSPDMPERYQQTIGYRAMMFYGRYDNAPEIHETAKEDYKESFDVLWNQQRPTVKMGKAPLS